MRNSDHILLPVINKDSKVLILGSFPSVKSMEKNFYYMHPQNRFYRILGELLGCDIYSKSIEEKEEILLKHHIALYDVIESCSIEGSSDSSIKNVVPCNVEKLIEGSNIIHIFINGKKAYDLFIKYNKNIRIPYTMLPSSSPANAKYSLKDLIEAWRIIKDKL